MAQGGGPIAITSTMKIRPKKKKIFHSDHQSQKVVYFVYYYSTETPYNCNCPAVSLIRYDECLVLVRGNSPVLQ
jgi:hypothetical protein